MRYADRVSRLGTETAFEVLDRVKALEAEGIEVISFALGEPDFDTPENIREAAKRALDDGQTHYSPSAGLPELRARIAEYMAETRKVPVTPEEIVVTPGAKKVLFDAMLACVNEGERVLYPSPGYPIYESVADFIGAEAYAIALEPDEGFRLDLDKLRAALTPNTRMIVLNSPQNPTGGVLEARDLEAIAKLAVERDLWVLSDEVYSRMVYEGEHLSIASIPGMKERTIVVDGASKTYAMTGWRLGWAMCNPELAQHLARLITNADSCTATFTQYAMLEALNGPQEEAERMKAEFQARRDLIVEGLNAIEGFSCHLPKGAFYVFPEVTEACKQYGFANSRELQDYLLYEGRVAVLHRECFGRKLPGEEREFIRLSYATSRSAIREGLERISQALAKR